MASVVVKKKDTYPYLAAQLQAGAPAVAIDLTTAVKVRFIAKPEKGGALIEGTCSYSATPSEATNKKEGKVEYKWAQTDLEPATPPETYKVEFEIEWPESGGVKRVQTVSNEGYYVLEVPGQGEAVGETLIYKTDDTFPAIKYLLTFNGVAINLEKGGPGGTACEKVTVVVKKKSSGAVILEKECTGWAGAGIKTVKDGKVEYLLHLSDLKTADEYTVEFVIEWPTTEGVKRLQTVPTPGYFPLKTVQDLGGAL